MPFCLLLLVQGEVSSCVMPGLLNQLNLDQYLYSNTLEVTLETCNGHMVTSRDSGRNLLGEVCTNYRCYEENMSLLLVMAVLVVITKTVGHIAPQYAVVI